MDKKRRNVIDKLDKKAKGLFQQLSNGKMCYECGHKKATVSHHIVFKRESKYLKWDYRNALPCCENCHIPTIHKEGWKLKDFTEWEHYTYLKAHINISLKQYLVEMGQTEEDFLQDRITELGYILTQN